MVYKLQINLTLISRKGALSAAQGHSFWGVCLPTSCRLKFFQNNFAAGELAKEVEERGSDGRLFLIASFPADPRDSRASPQHPAHGHRAHPGPRGRAGQRSRDVFGGQVPGGFRSLLRAR